MTGGDARRGRRDNGLVAADYAAAGDVDPRVGEHLLDVLGLDGIAAYLRPSTDLNPITRSSTLPDRPTDRLYVDRAHLDTARAYLKRLSDDAAKAEVADSAPAPKSPGDAEMDDAWAQIVAGYDDEAPDHSWPAVEDVPSEDHRVRRSDASPRPTHFRIDPEPLEPSLLDGLDTFGADLPDAEEEGYTPPAAPPVPRPSLPTALGIAGIILGLIIFLKPDLLPMNDGIAMFIGFAAVVAGFGTLVWRLRPGDDPDDTDSDDGARV